MQQIPVYSFTGFLDSGKTKFIQETLEDRRFCNGERTLLLVCEEGEEEYAPDQFADKSVFIRIIEDQSELNPEHLTALLKETRAERVVIEYNGMWMLDVLYGAMPEGWMVYQEFFFADARTFLVYNENMRQLVYDKLKSCELAVFNRFTPDMDKMAFHRIVRGASRRCDIAYEAPDGSFSPVPDLNALRKILSSVLYLEIKDGKVTDIRENEYYTSLYNMSYFDGVLTLSLDSASFPEWLLTELYINGEARYFEIHNGRVRLVV